MIGMDNKVGPAGVSAGNRHQTLLRDRRAFTLIETLVAAALLVVLGVITWQMISFGIKAHRKGEAVRQAQTFSKEILGKITDELRGAVAIPDSQFSTPPLFPVLWPGGQNPPKVFSGALYKRTTGTDSDTGRAFQTVSNRLIFSRPGRDASTFDPYRIEHFVLVEYLIEPGKDNILKRRVYAVKPRDMYIVSGNAWGIEPGKFDGSTSLDAGASSDYEEVVQLPHASDRIRFEVTNMAYSDPKIPYDYSVSTFKITVKTFIGLRVDRPGEANDEFDGQAELTEEVRVRSVNGSL